MRLAAIYIDSHSYLFDEPQTINFGAKYIYSFKKNQEANVIDIVRELSTGFIEGFFDITSIDVKLSNVNAIVGQNGAGKTSILNLLSQIVSSEQADFTPATCIVVFEHIDSDEIVLFKDNTFRISSNLNNLSIKDWKSEKIETIYFSPHFDLKDERASVQSRFNVSLDRLIEDDLKNYPIRFESFGEMYFSPKFELILKNSARQLKFIKSTLAKKDNVFAEIFDFPEHDQPILIIGGSAVKYDKVKGFAFSNTPTQFQRPLDKIYQKIQEELEQRRGGQLTEKASVYFDAPHSHLYIFKRYCIIEILGLIIRHFESSNAYLDEGNISGVNVNEDLQLGSKELLFRYLDNFYVYPPHFKQSSRKKAVVPRKVFDIKLVEMLIESLYNAVDKVTDYSQVKNSQIPVSLEDAEYILRCQQEFISDLKKYFNLYRDKEHNLGNMYGRDIEPFISYRPTNLNLSSGQNALLNLFSSIYDLVTRRKEEIERMGVTHFLLLFDEADLAFHPEWKRRYVKALVSSLPYFFKHLKTKPSIEIVITTHNPISLSDFPNSNVIYIERHSNDAKPRILTKTDNRPQKTFGANISDLLADSFFLKDGLMGKFAEEKIYKTINWLNKRDEKEDAEYHKKVIAIIDEPIVQKKLAEMYDSKMKSDLEVELIAEKIRILEEELNRKRKK